MKVYKNLFEQITSAENLFLAWDEFKRGKTRKTDVMRFEWQLEQNLLSLQDELKKDRYKHGRYYAFYIHDPKQRLIHKASVSDRIVHHAIFKILNPIFEPTFIAESFSCRVGKGTHKGVRTLAKMLRQTSHNHSRQCYALKCDIHKFFASVDHSIVLNILKKRISDEPTLKLLVEIIDSFSTLGLPGKGLPIGNLTSQLFANIYMNEFDQFVKHKLKVKNYVRYTDDFVIVSTDEQYLKGLMPEFQNFLESNLKLKLHPTKVSIRKYTSGVDFLGYVVLPHYIKLRSKTRRRILVKVNNKNLSSYLGVCSHANAYGVSQDLLLKARLNTEMLEYRYGDRADSEYGRVTGRPRRGADRTNSAAA